MPPHEPYSDFNFASLWSWNVENTMACSIIHGNLALRFSDYLTNEHFYTYLGAAKHNESARELLDLAIYEKLTPRLRLVPEISVRDLDRDVFKVTEDRDHFDYILPVDALKKYDTKETHSRGRAMRRFLAEKPEHSVRTLDLSDPATMLHIRELMKRGDKVADDDKELLAVARFIQNAKVLDYFALGIFIDDKLAAFYIGEHLKHGFTMGHFWKADTRISTGLYAYLLNRVAYALSEKGEQFINIEQDLGLPNLRRWKQSYGTNLFHKKYCVEFM
jgi:hypothetical protein